VLADDVSQQLVNKRELVGAVTWKSIAIARNTSPDTTFT
jgi:hypothetical protein